ncbi:hypothetical protein [Kitasatospora sp. NPDC047058]|uniref:hypothetical protein n=1 Tax=Kitasatospora sp. NPDC047058 TaxID=3155620 RepID=UPI0033CF5165
MSNIRHRTPAPVVTPGTDELGRVGWLVVGFVALVVGAIMHALRGVFGIARSMTSPTPQRTPAGGRPAPAAGLSAGETGGWIIIGALFMVAGVMTHAVAGVVQSIKEALHTTREQSPG